MSRRRDIRRTPPGRELSQRDCRDVATIANSSRRRHTTRQTQ